MDTSMHPGCIRFLIALGIVTASPLESGWGQEPGGRPRLIICEVEGSAVIFSIIPDGAAVDEGQLVFELDSTALKQKLAHRRVVREAIEESCLEARKTREAAEIAAAEYENATIPQDLATAQGEIKLAEADLVRATDRVEWAKRMHEKGFVARAQKISEELNHQKARFALEQAQSKMKVLQGYTRPKTVKELSSQIAKARFDERATNRVLELERAKLAYLQQQIDRCRIFAPVAGKVVHVSLKGDPHESAPAFPRPGVRVQHGEILALVVPMQTSGPQSADHATSKVPADETRKLAVISPIAGTAVINSILPAATRVKRGQVVCELDASDLKDELAAQTLAAAQAEFDLGTRRNVLEIAELALREYREGQYALEKASLEGELKIGEAKLSQAGQQLNQARLNVQKDPLAVSQGEIVQARARLHVEQAQARLRLLENFTNPRQIRTLEMGVRHAANEVQLATKRLSLERAKSENLERRIALCRIVAPVDGTVVAVSAFVGQSVNEGQPLLELEPTEEPGRPPKAP
jgi:multidrug resistance efflux pump